MKKLPGILIAPLAVFASQVVALTPQTAAAATPTPREACINAPVSSALMVRSSCLYPTPDSAVVSGSPTGNAADGMVVFLKGSQQRITTFSNSGPITAAVAVNTICLIGAKGGAASLDPKNGDLGPAPAGCGAPGSSRLVATQASAPATTSPHAASTALTRPAATSMSYYVYPGDLTNCPAGATTGCRLYNLGASEPAGTLAIIDFGAPCYLGTTGNPTEYGTQLFGWRTCTPLRSIAAMAQDFVSGYLSTHGPGSPAEIIGVGTSNSYTGALPCSPGCYAMSDTEMRAHGQSWFSTVVSQINGQGRATIWAASDIEQEACNTGNYYCVAPTRAWVDGYRSAAGLTQATACGASSSKLMADYGDDVVGNGDWTAADIYYVAYGAPGSCAVPEIYYSANATEWAQLSSQAQQPAITFTGVMSEGGLSGSLCSDNSWSALANATGQSIPYLTVIGGSIGCGYGGYNILTSFGGIYSFGTAQYYGNLIDHGYPGPGIGLGEMPAGDGYQILNTGGGLYSFGSAQGHYYGNLIDHHYPGPAVALSVTPSGNGYAILTSFGGLYTFGDALYEGNLIDHHYPGQAVGIAYTPSGRGYNILTSSGAIYSFGDAQYYGNLLDHNYPGPAVSLTYTRTGGGYAILTSSGGLYTFGDAVYKGNLIDHGYPGPATAISNTP